MTKEQAALGEQVDALSKRILRVEESLGGIGPWAAGWLLPPPWKILSDLHLLVKELAERLPAREPLSRDGGAVSADTASRWQYLVARPHPWRRQLNIKGRNMTVGQLVSSLRANRLSPEQAAEEFDLPPAAVYEALAYHAENHALIELEASEERRRLAERGYALEPKDLPR